MTMQHLSAGALALSLLILPLGAAADPAEVERGKELSATCATCHGSNGIATMPIYPNLAGQNEKYLVAALKAYREGQRQGGTAGLMTPVAGTLSDEDIAALAKYYASLEPNG